jgi:hypothetical protein
MTHTTEEVTAFEAWHGALNAGDTNTYKERKHPW